MLMGIRTKVPINICHHNQCGWWGFLSSLQIVWLFDKQNHCASSDVEGNGRLQLHRPPGAAMTKSLTHLDTVRHPALLPFLTPKSNLLLENDMPNAHSRNLRHPDTPLTSSYLPITTGLSNSTCTSISARPSGETRPRIGEIPTPSGTLSTWYTATFFPPFTMGIERSAGSPTAKTPRSSLLREVLVQPATIIIPLSTSFHSKATIGQKRQKLISKVMKNPSKIFQPLPPLHAEVHVCLWRLPHTTKAVIVPIFNLQKSTSANTGPKLANVMLMETPAEKKNKTLDLTPCNFVTAHLHNFVWVKVQGKKCKI